MDAMSQLISVVECTLLIFFVTARLSEGLYCYTCPAAKTNYACNKQITRCGKDETGCSVTYSVRSTGHFRSMSKSCVAKCPGRQGCHDNGSAPRVCRNCCTEDKCNVGLIPARRSRSSDNTTARSGTEDDFVAFSLRGDDVINLGNDEDLYVRIDEVLINMGPGYNEQMGISEFTPEINGVYSFHVSTTANVGGNHAEPLVLLKNEVIAMRIGRKPTENVTALIPTAYNHVILSLELGDIVRLLLVPRGADNLFSLSDPSEVTFSGYLLSKTLINSEEL